MTRVLLVDDDPDLSQLVSDYLRREAPDLRVETVDDASGLDRALAGGQVDLVITDYQLGWTDGFAVFREVRARRPDCPVIMFTGSGNEEVAVEALNAGLDDYIVKPNHLMRLPAAIRAVLKNREQNRAVRAAGEELRRAAEQARTMLNGSIQAIARMTEMRDPYTAGHQRRVSELACAIAGEVGLPAAQTEYLHVAGMLHDIGKIVVPAEILIKPTPFSVHERAIIQAHARAGYDILQEIDFPGPIAQAVVQHHERLDGSGYPAGLSGDAIIPEVRILAVADVVDAMTSNRPYRPALDIEAALAQIARDRGRRLDVEAVDACRRLIIAGSFQIPAPEVGADEEGLGRLPAGRPSDDDGTAGERSGR